MKRMFGFLTGLTAVLLLAGSTSFAQQSTTFNLSLTVNPYIQTMPGPVNVNLGSTRHNAGYGTNQEWFYDTAPQSWDLAYANTPFTVTVSGNNPANQGIPRFARAETGNHSNGFDTLPTLYAIHFTTNGVSDLFFGTWLQGANQFPYTKQYQEAPHNGQIRMDLDVYANANIASEAIPIRQTVIDPSYKWDQSADAGVYQASLTVTLGAI